MCALRTKKVVRWFDIVKNTFSWFILIKESYHVGFYETDVQSCVLIFIFSELACVVIHICLWFLFLTSKRNQIRKSLHTYLGDSHIIGTAVNFFDWKDKRHPLKKKWKTQQRIHNQDLPIVYSTTYRNEIWMEEGFQSSAYVRFLR